MRKIIFTFLFFTSLNSIAQKQQYKIVYNVFEDTARDNYDIYSMNMDGSDKEKYHEHPGSGMGLLCLRGQSLLYQ